MSALSIQPTYPIFTDIDGQPLEAGYVWIGTVNLDPQVNPISAYWDAALTISAAQPIRTLAGYPSNSGTPARLYANSDYSIRVMNKNGGVVYSAVSATERYSAELVGYLPAGTGAVATTVQGKLRLLPSAEDYGTSFPANASAFQAAFQNYSFFGAVLPSGNTGSNNVAFGAFALSSLTNGTRNIAFGTNALQNTTGGASPAPGSQLGYGSGNVAIGVGALLSNTTGYENMAIGDLGLISNTTGKWNLAVGHRSLIANTVGVNNIAIGPYVLSLATTAQYNLGIGFGALEATTGAENIAIGDVAMNGVTTGYQNVCIGRNTMYSTGTGYRNVAIGLDVLKLNTSGYWNCALGIYSMSSNTTGYANVSLGYLAMTANIGGFNNVAVGQQALSANLTGNNNTAVGMLALSNDTARVNATALGYNAQPTANNQIVLGDANITSLICAAFNKKAWTPVDSSGAGLVLTLNGTPRYVRVGDLIQVFLDVTYPVTASGLGMLLGGLPAVAGVDSAGNIGFTDYSPAAPVFTQVSAGSQGIRIQTSGGATLTNAQVSGRRFQISASYFA